MPSKTATTKPATQSDSEIRRDVLRRMKDDLDVLDDRLTVAVDGGVVTISGVVPHDSQREAAGRCLKHAKGVREVVNKIEVNPNSVLSE